MTDAPIVEPSHADAVPPLSGRRYVVLTLLTLGFTLSFMDRTVLGSLGEALKQEFSLTDTQYGLLQGPAFVVFYVLMCIPIARLAERFNRVVIVAGSIGLWSVFTTLSGFAGGYSQLVLYRMGVGLGESGSGPASQSILSDYFPAAQRPFVASIFYLGIPLGILLGAVFGGYFTSLLGWRWAFIVLGVPGIILALVILVVVKEPKRGAQDALATLVSRPPPSFNKVLARLFSTPSFRNLLAGAVVASCATYGLASFTAPFFLRRFDLDFAQVGILYGVVTGLSYGVGTFVGGYVCNRLARRDRRWYALLPALTVAAAAPLYILAFHQGSWLAMGLLLVIPGILHTTYIGPMNGTIQNLVRADMRATTVAIVFVVTNIIALGLAPPLTGMLIDHLSELAFASYGFADFAAACPAGLPASGIAAEVASACRPTLADSTRWALTAVSVLLVWAAGHFFLASRHMAADLDRAAD